MSMTDEQRRYRAGPGRGHGDAVTRWAAPIERPYEESRTLTIELDGLTAERLERYAQDCSGDAATLAGAAAYLVTDGIAERYRQRGRRGGWMYPHLSEGR